MSVYDCTHQIFQNLLLVLEQMTMQCIRNNENDGMKVRGELSKLGDMSSSLKQKI